MDHFSYVISSVAQNKLIDDEKKREEEKRKDEQRKREEGQKIREEQKKKRIEEEKKREEVASNKVIPDQVLKMIRDEINKYLDEVRKN